MTKCIKTGTDTFTGVHKVVPLLLLKVRSYSCTTRDNHTAASIRSESGNSQMWIGRFSTAKYLNKKEKMEKQKGNFLGSGSQKTDLIK